MNLSSLPGAKIVAVWKAKFTFSASAARGHFDSKLGEQVPLLHDALEQINRRHLVEIEERPVVLPQAVKVVQAGDGPGVGHVVADRGLATWAEQHDQRVGVVGAQCPDELIVQP